MRTRQQPHIVPLRRGFILLAVLMFIFLLSMITMSLLFRSKGDETAGHATSGSEQAWSAAMSGVEEAMRVAATAPAGSSDWMDDPSVFKARAVYDDGADQWFFTIFSPADSGSLAEIRYGLTDEASKLNLNHPGNADLTKIPGLTPTLAGALRQFTGQNATPTNRMDLKAADAPEPPIEPPLLDPAQVSLENQVPRHGPLATLDELLLLPGMSRALLHGAPPSADFQVGTAINADGPQLPSDNSKTKHDRGLEQYFTVFSRDPNRTDAGQRRCNVNDLLDPLPASDLPAGFSNYVATLRTNKVQLAHLSDALEATLKTTDQKGVEVEVASEITKENLPRLLDLFGTDKETGHDGLVNVNTASAIVLAALPGIDAPLADSIISTRTGLAPERRASLAWLYQEGVVDAARFKIIAPNLTARSAQFHLNVIGYGLPSGRFRVLEVVIDLAGTEPHIIYLRDVTRLGLPISLKEENIANPNSTTASFSTFRDHPHG